MINEKKLECLKLAITVADNAGGIRKIKPNADESHFEADILDVLKLSTMFFEHICSKDVEDAIVISPKDKVLEELELKFGSNK